MPHLTLETGRRSITGHPLNDLSARLGLANLPYGLAKIRYVQEQLGIEPDARFEATPDFSVTRNRSRWKAGFAYGGILRWAGDLVILDLKPNACGMLVGAYDCDTIYDVSNRIKQGLPEALELSHGVARWDFDFSNHFFQIYRCRDSRVTGLNRYDCVFVLHGSGKEFRHRLYYDHPDFTFARQVQVRETPWGPLRCLTGQAAVDYQAGFMEVEAFSKERREAFARTAFGNFRVIANTTHQGLVEPGKMLLGAVDANQGEPVPFTLREELPAFLLTSERGRVALPHGGGYVLTREGDSVHVNGEHDDHRVVTVGSGADREIVEDIRSEPFGYRGGETLEKALTVPHVVVAAELHPVWRIQRKGLRVISPAQT